MDDMLLIIITWCYITVLSILALFTYIKEANKRGNADEPQFN